MLLPNFQEEHEDFNNSKEFKSFPYFFQSNTHHEKKFEKTIKVLSCHFSKLTFK